MLMSLVAKQTVRVPALISDSDRLNAETADRRPAFFSAPPMLFSFFSRVTSALAHTPPQPFILRRVFPGGQTALSSSTPTHARPRVRARGNTRLAVFLRHSCVLFITPRRLCFHAAPPNHLSSLCAAFVVRQHLQGPRGTKTKNLKLNPQQRLLRWLTANINMSN